MAQSQGLFRGLLKIVVICTILIGLAVHIRPDPATLWDKPYTGYYGGNKLDVDIPADSCLAVGASFANKVMSIDTKGTCIYLFKTADCTGESYKVFQYDLAANNMSMVGFANQVKSLHYCGLDGPRPIIFYPQVNYGGKPTTLPLPATGKCVDAPKTGFNPLSVKTKYNDYCFLIWGKAGCKGGAIRFRGNGTYGSKDLRLIGWNGYVKSAQICRGHDNPNTIFGCSNNASQPSGPPSDE